MNAANYSNHVDAVNRRMKNGISIPDAIRQLSLKDSCGCAMGAKFMLMGVLISIPYYGWMYHRHAIAGFAAFWHGFIFIFIASGLGKVTGLLLHRIVTNEVRSAKGNTHY
jgi:hypothetical protein